jgi:hypothetical protein
VDAICTVMGESTCGLPGPEGAANEEANHETYSVRGHIAAGSRRVGTLNSRTLGCKLYQVGLSYLIEWLGNHSFKAPRSQKSAGK